MEVYTPHFIAAALRNAELESEDVDFKLDLDMGIERLPQPYRLVLKAYREGISPGDALELRGLHNLNAHRIYQRAIRMLTSILNGTRVPQQKGD